MASHLHLGFYKGLFPVGLPVKILKALLPSSILATRSAHLNILDLIILTILGKNNWLEHENSKQFSSYLGWTIN